MSTLTADEQQLHEAILSVFDERPDGPRFFFEGQKILCANGTTVVVSEETANDERLRFSMWVIETWRRFKTPSKPGLGESETITAFLQRLANLCTSHQGKELPPTTVIICTECERERNA